LVILPHLEPLPPSPHFAALRSSAVVITTGAAGWGWLWRSWLGRLWRRWKWILAVPCISNIRAIDVVPINLARVGNNTAEREAGDGYG